MSYTIVSGSLHSIVESEVNYNIKKGYECSQPLIVTSSDGVTRYTQAMKWKGDNQ